MSKISEFLEDVFAPEVPAPAPAEDPSPEFELSEPEIEPTYTFEAAPKEPKRKKRSTRELILARRS